MNFIDKLSLYMPYLLGGFLPLVIYAAYQAFKPKNAELKNKVSNVVAHVDEEISTAEIISQTVKIYEPNQPVFTETLNSYKANALVVLSKTYDFLNYEKFTQFANQNNKISVENCIDLRPMLKNKSYTTTSVNNRPSIQTMRAFQAHNKVRKHGEFVITDEYAFLAGKLHSMKMYKGKYALRKNSLPKFSITQTELLSNSIKDSNLAVLALSKESHLKHDSTAYNLARKRIKYNSNTHKFSVSTKFRKFEELKDDSKPNRLLLSANQRVS
ncbi:MULTISPECIES: hypothetical protein [Acinetobacter]|uniref:hypothetical protein n=1 Tax=Acinetobacter TaxID=469 RepID=UPI00143A3687|nr:MULTISPECIES: hypothetical protein [Acinetobacter]MDD0801231.1 hypothetical protein [Acinetobacter sp. Gutcm_16]NKG38869.1 hypothetical protein [Acinetobacter johnsonii]